MLGYPFGRMPAWNAVKTLPLLVLAQAVNVLGFFWQWWKGFPAIPLSVSAP
jgi:hypothetical protein